MHSSMGIKFSKNVYGVPLDAPAEESANGREELGHVISFGPIRRLYLSPKSPSS